MELTTDLAKKLSIEERSLYNTIHNNSADFMKQIFGEKQWRLKPNLAAQL